MPSVIQVTRAVFSVSCSRPAVVDERVKPRALRFVTRAMEAGRHVGVAVVAQEAKTFAAQTTHAVADLKRQADALQQEAQAFVAHVRAA